MVGAVRGIDPMTGFSYDDTKRLIDAASLSEENRRKIFETNARKVYRLDRVAALSSAGRQ
jgi:4-oxalmesaconate hydratase